jgi:transposase
MKTKDARSLSPEAQEALRMKAVQAVLEGRTKTEVAELFGVTRQTVGGWVKAYREHGEKALRAQRQGRPKGQGTRLAPWQMAQVAKTLRDKMPDQLKRPFYLWTRQDVPFASQAGAGRGSIYWGDEMGLRSDHVAGRSWGLKGKTPVVDTTGKRFGCSMISAITNRGQLSFMVFKGRFTGPVFLRFLRRLAGQSDRKVFLIVDGHPVHRARTVKAWLEAHVEDIELFYLPSYSPHLNPDEILNQDIKSNAVGRNRARDLPELMANVRRFLRSRQRRPLLVCRYFLERHVRYAAAQTIPRSP